MFTIIFLGNPGKEYEFTRHNAGRIVGQAVAKKLKISLESSSKLKSLVGEGVVDGVKVRLLMPETFMNKSGDTIKNTSINPKKCLIVHDDADLPMGRLKFSFAKRDGGHKGVASVLRALKTRDVWRARIGIQKKKRVSAEDIVLAKFSPAERLLLTKISKTFVEAVPVIVTESFEKASSLYSR